MKKVKNRGELNLSFGMIFSIILIVAFVAFSFFAIKKFLDFQETISVEKFKEDLKIDIENLWKGGGNEGVEAEYNLPGKITAVCFKDDDYENLYFESDKFYIGAKIEHLDIIATLEGEDFACFENTNGKVKMILKKDFSDVLVTIMPFE